MVSFGRIAAGSLGLLALNSCAPPQHITQLMPGALPSSTIPTPIDEPLTGFENLHFGMTPAQVIQEDPTFEADFDQSGSFLSSTIHIDSCEYLENVYFGGTPGWLSAINLISVNIKCPPINVWNSLTAKYGYPILDNDGGNDSYDWTFKNGAILRFINTSSGFLGDGSVTIAYIAPEGPKKTGSL